MKSIITISLLILGVFNIKAQQWEQKVSNTTADLSDVFFVDESIGFAVGSSGTIIKSMDGGESWTALTSGTNEHLESVCFINATTGFTVGFNIMLKTDDGGVNWSTVNLPLSVEWTDVEFIDATIGFCVGKHGTILKTSDGGTTWVQKDSDCTRFLAKIQFPTANVGYATSRGYNSNFIKTIDGGETWFNDTIDAAMIYGSMESVYFTSENSGVIGSWYLAGLVKTDDGGISWTDVSGGTNPDIYSIDFADAQTGFAVGNNGLVMTTIDGGDSWTSITLASGIYPTAIQAITPTTAIAVGYGGCVVKNNQATNSVNVQSLDNQVSVYPNPFVDQFTIELPENVTSARVTLTSISGDIVAEERLLSDHVSGLAGLSRGTYLLRVEFGDIKLSRLVVK